MNSPTACVRLALVLLASCCAPGTRAQEREDEEQELDEIVVTAPRLQGLVRDQPLRIEALPAEEIEENLTIQPGNVTSLLAELPGVRMQSAAPGLGGTRLALRGMPGRHTLVLSDGLPLLGTDPDSFSLLQTPPLDLAQVEVMKGVASAQYGGGPLGGVLNLIPTRPDAEPSMLANFTSLDGQDLAGLLTHDGASPWSGTLVAGVHHQSRQDVDADGWVDLPRYQRYTLRPRAWWKGANDGSASLTIGVLDEDRSGGTLPGRTLPDGSRFTESLRTRRIDAGAVVTLPLGSEREFTGRMSVTRTDLDREFGTHASESSETNVSAEAVWNGRSGPHAWLVGLGIRSDSLDVSEAPWLDYTYGVPAVFAQDDFDAAPWLRVSGSLRADFHDEFGTYVSPRLSLLFREPGSDWSVRVSAGTGFAAPTPFADEVEATWLGALLPYDGLDAERAVGGSLDLRWSDEGWDVNVSAFTTELSDGIEAIAAPAERLQLVNMRGTRRATGAEFLLGYVTGPLHMIGSWTYLDVTQPSGDGGRQETPLIPRHSGEIAAILEDEHRGRLGLEVSYTGRQALDDDPYRTESESYVEVNALAELRLGEIAVFLNAINLTDERQTKFDPLLRPTPGPGGVLVTDVWAPLAGRTFNLGIRSEF